MKCARSRSLSFFFTLLGWHQSFFPRAPWKTNGLPLESIWQRCMRGWNKEMSTWFMCHMISSTIVGRTKEAKNDSFFLHFGICCFDKQAFSRRMKEMCHLSQNFLSFHYFVCPSTARFCFAHCFWSSFWGAEGSIVSFCVSASLLSLSLSFALFKIWCPTFVSVPNEKRLECWRWGIFLFSASHFK